MQLEWPCAQIYGAVQRLHRPMALIRGRLWSWKGQNEDRLFLSYLWHRSRLDAVLSQMCNLCSVIGPTSALVPKCWVMGAISICIIRLDLLRSLPTSTNHTATFGVWKGINFRSWLWLKPLHLSQSHFRLILMKGASRTLLWKPTWIQPEPSPNFFTSPWQSWKL